MAIRDLYDAGNPLSDDDRRALDAIGRPLRRPDGHTFARRGEHAAAALLIRAGQVAIVATGAPTRTLAQPGELIGLGAALRSTPHAATLVAFGEVDVLELPSEPLRELLADRPQLAVDLLALTALQLDHAHVLIAEAGRTVAERLARTLVDLIDSGHGRETPDGVRIVLNQQDLAGLTGASLDAIKKTVRTFKDDGLIRTGRNALTICDRTALAAYAEEA